MAFFHKNIEEFKEEFDRQECMLKFATKRDFWNFRMSAKVMFATILQALVIGAVAAVFLFCLHLVTRQRQLMPILFVFLPVVAVITAYVYRHYGKSSLKGNNLVIESAVFNKDVPLRMAILVFFCTLATHITGGSAGREGTAIQMGGTIGANVGRLFKLNKGDHRTLVLAGISSAFAGVFGTPLAGTFFGLEMCFIGKLEYHAIIYCMVGAFTANKFARFLGAENTFAVIKSVPDIDPYIIFVVLASAIVFGLVARFFSWAVQNLKRFYAHIFPHYLLDALFGSILVAGLFIIFGWQRYGGLSEWLILSGFEGTTSFADPFIKMLLTILTLGAGLQGGEVTPLFGVGASLGGWIGEFSHVETSFMAALGLIAVFGAAANCPLTTIMLGVDMFGGEAAPYFIIAAFVSYYVSGHRSIYGSQIIATPKRRGLNEDAELTVAEALALHKEELEEYIEKVKEDEDFDPYAIQGEEPTNAKDRVVSKEKFNPHKKAKKPNIPIA